MLAIQVPTWMRRVAAPMSCAVAMTSLFTSAAKIASKPASSASRAIVWISLARQPIPGMTASPSRSAMGVLLSFPLQSQILHRRRVRVAPDQVHTRLLDARSHAPDERQLVDRDLRHPIVEDLLDLMQQSFTLLHVRLAGLALEQVLDVRHDAGRVDAALAHVGFEPRGRVATGARDADDHVLQLVLPPRRRQGGALHHDHLRPD